MLKRPKVIVLEDMSSVSLQTPKRSEHEKIKDDIQTSLENALINQNEGCEKELEIEIEQIF